MVSDSPFVMFFWSEHSYVAAKGALNLDSKWSSSHNLLPTVCQSPPVPHPHILTQIEPKDIPQLLRVLAAKSSQQASSLRFAFRQRDLFHT